MRKPVLKKGMKFPNSNVFKEALREYAIKKPIDIKFKLNEKKKIQVYRTKRKATNLITRDEQLQYGKLRDYAEMIRLNDKGSRVILQTEMEDENAQPKFKRMYIRYNAQKVGFLGDCRPIIGLDGCHLKGIFGGQIIFATDRDGNDNIFPVTFVVVKQENKDSWVWFLQQFSDGIGNPKQLNLVFITNRQKGFILAIEMLFPTCEHRYCVKHIYNNFKVDHMGLELKDARGDVLKPQQSGSLRQECRN
ncbi:uncharacterized protein LOC142628940 [Castanea sativa]|uniref:uncharacterized protein LOC142628940 n=1 Tax=Castanea sativa TaxID=21020 RepID=UPI003F64CBB8